MIKPCKSCQQNFDITDNDLKFYEKVSPVFEGKKYLIPSPTLCPECRQQRRLSFRNERNLYKRKCDLCKKDIISIYSLDNKYIVYCPDCWWSDKWDALEYGKNYDFNKSFFEQYEKLTNGVPKLSIQNTKSENSEYTNYSERNKNCYMLFGSSECEDCYYGNRIFKSENIVDCFDVYNSQLSYECLECINLYNCCFCKNSQNLYNSIYCYDCITCSNCSYCINLKNKKFNILNEQYTEKKYLEIISNFSKQKKIIEKFKKLQISVPHKSNINIKSENIFGDQLFNCKKCFNSYSLKYSEQCSYSYMGINNKYCYDSDFFDNSELQYESLNLEQNYNVNFANLAWYSHNCYYISFCFNSNNLFGCVGLNHKQHCILNKQYTKKEYEKLVPRIIEKMQIPQPPLSRGQSVSPLDKGDLGDCEWGEFFSSSLSPFGYNGTVAQEYFPLTKEEALSKGFNWSDYEPEFPKVEKIIPADLLPDAINQIPDDILNWAIQCEVTGKPFKIIKPELDFYRKMNLPIPRRHPDQIHKDRMALRNPRKLWSRNCVKCNVEIQTTYSPDRSEIVCCEKCYLATVY